MFGGGRLRRGQTRTRVQAYTTKGVTRREAFLDRDPRRRGGARLDGFDAGPGQRASHRLGRDVPVPDLLYTRILSKPQLFIEGNHRAG